MPVKKKATAIAKRPPAKKGAGVPSGKEGVEPFPETGAPSASKSRVKDVKSAHALYVRFLKDDETSAHNRMLVRDVAEGAAPFAETDVEQDGRFNLNFHDLAAQANAAASAYIDLTDSVPFLAHMYIDPKDGVLEDVEREDKQRVIAKNWTLMVREWPEFDVYWEMLVNELSGHGVGMAFFESDEGWKFLPAGWDDFCIPRQTKATEEAISTMFIRRTIPVCDVWELIKDADSAERVGWNVSEVRKALVCATKGESKSRNWELYWAEVQDELANNDIGVSYATGDDLVWVHQLVREYDKTYTHNIFLDSGKNEQFLYQRRSRYTNAASAFTIFVTNVGRNGKYHAARGVLYQAYPFAQSLNRLRSGSLDSTALSMATMLQPGDSETMEDMAVVLSGPVAWLPGGATLAPNRQFPQLAQNALPMIADLERTMQTNLSCYRTPRSAEANATNKFGQRVQGEQEGSLVGSQLNKFFRSLRRLYGEMWRRTVAIGPDNARKYPEVALFYERCANQGVEPDDIASVSRVEPFRAVGAGSPAVRMNAYDEAIETIGMLDETGRKRLLYDRYAGRFGQELAEYYVGSPDRPRFVIDEKIAELENSAMRDEADIVAEPGENDAVHAQVHLGRTAKEMQPLVEAASSGDEPDVQMLTAGLVRIQRLLVHVQPHLEALALDPTRRELFGNLRKMFQQLSAQWQGVANVVRKATPTQTQQAVALSKMELRQREHDLEMALLVDDHRTRMQLLKESTAAKAQTMRLSADARTAAQISSIQ